jgi:hypothetical protein
MSRVEQLEQRILELNAAELKELRAWFDRYDAEAWDGHIENDSKAGKLSRLIDQALSDDRSGHSTKL